MNKILVYGSLKKGYGNHRLLERATFLGQATTVPSFTLLDLGHFPGIVRSGSTPVMGELYEVDAETLARLDRLEGHPGFYRREAIDVVLEDGSLATVEGYVLPLSWLHEGRVTQIPSGSWPAGRV